MATLTPEQERTLARMKAAAANAKMLPDAAAASMAARTTEVLGFDAKGKPFKPEDMIDIFADMEDDEFAEDKPLRQAS